MIELTTSGRKVAINPAHVVAVDDNGTGSVLTLVSRQELRVVESYEQVMALLRKDSTPPAATPKRETK